jgi:hypothetical protein
MKLWDRMRGITTILAVNSAWLETQDERLDRLEREYQAMREETAEIRRYHESQRRLMGDQS